MVSTTRVEASAKASIAPRYSWEKKGSEKTRSLVSGTSTATTPTVRVARARAIVLGT